MMKMSAMDSANLIPDLTPDWPTLEAVMMRIGNATTFRLSNDEEEKGFRILEEILREKRIPYEIERWPIFVSTTQTTLEDGMHRVYPSRGYAMSMPLGKDERTGRDAAGEEAFKTEGQVLHGKGGKWEEFLRNPEKFPENAVWILEGMPGVELLRTAQALHVRALLFNTGSRMRHSIVSDVWGSPTEESDLERYLDIPCASIEAETASSLLDGDWVALYTLRTSYWTLSPIVHLIAGESLEQAAESEKDSVLLTAHFDSWGSGAVDNLSGVATIVGIMEKAAQMGSALPRRLDAFIWSGHSHGRYAGSTAWIDHHFAWASQHALLNINVDCLGANNSEITGRLPFSPAAHELARAALAHCAPGVALSRVPLSRSCDQSFFAAGIPTLFSNVSEVVPQKGEEAFAAPGLAPIYGPHWHTEDDDLRAVDEDRLKRDAALVARGAALAVAYGAESLSAWREFDALFHERRRNEGRRASCGFLRGVRISIQQPVATSVR